MKPAKMPRTKRGPNVIGWRELVDLPDFGVTRLPAKVDTGARTSALHAVDQDLIERDGVTWVSFRIPTPGRPRTERFEAPIIDERNIKNTSGASERRLIIRTTLVLGQRRWRIEASLANREKMEFDLILGRTAIRRHGLLVDPGKSFVLGSAKELDPVAAFSAAHNAPSGAKQGT